MIRWDILARMADRIERENRFDMLTFGSCERIRNGELCGTSACLAGHIVWEYQPETFKKFVVLEETDQTIDNGECPDIFEIAMGIVGLDRYDAEDLFTPNCGVMLHINDNKELVPAAIRWMVDNKTICWRSAGDAVGFTPIKEWMR
jgi:hypothetical protein